MEVAPFLIALCHTAPFIERFRWYKRIEQSGPTANTHVTDFEADFWNVNLLGLHRKQLVNERVSLSVEGLCPPFPVRVFGFIFIGHVVEDRLPVPIDAPEGRCVHTLKQVYVFVSTEHSVS